MLLGLPQVSGKRILFKNHKANAINITFSFQDKIGHTEFVEVTSEEVGSHTFKSAASVQEPDTQYERSCDLPLSSPLCLGVVNFY